MRELGLEEVHSVRACLALSRLVFGLLRLASRLVRWPSFVVPQDLATSSVPGSVSQSHNKRVGQLHSGHFFMLQAQPRSEDDPAEVVSRQGSSVHLAITVEVDESAEGAVTVRVLS
jgi:hypothetical protein